ncbi:hypothetical protein HMN09_00673200 [Mycena chlorophos]|uniref:MMS19 nucleotide excision repair protein n=1 Tax=Mycena chlorophos TaxID=658473 RepID=A0A8H6WB33_MYCCL|nr:hypothetical protein HMN09_00673200 [Mycena chlorophos]
MKISRMIGKSLSLKSSARLIHRRNSALKLLITVSAQSLTPIREQSLPLLFAALPSTPPGREDSSARARYQTVLSVLSTLSTPTLLFAALVAELYPRIVAVAFPSSAETDPELSAAFLHSLLLAIKRALGTKVDDKHDDVGDFVDTLLPGLYGVCVRAALQGGPARDRRVVAVIADIIGLVLQRLSPEKQQIFASKLFPAFLSGEIAAICTPEYIAAGFRFIPFEADATTSERDLLVLFEASVAPLDKSVVVDADINACVQRILDLGLTRAENQLQEGSVLRIVASIVNKHVDELGAFLEEKSATFWSTQIVAVGSTDKRRQAIRAWTWISKALLVRSHPQSLPFIERLFSVFSDPDIGTDAAKAFGLLAGRDETLTKKNGAVVRILWAQKFAIGILPKLMGGAKDTSTNQARVYLVALTALIKAVPHAAYSAEMPALFPLLLRALALPMPDAGVRADVVETLLEAVVTSPPIEKGKPSSSSSTEDTVLSEHAASLARTMLSLARPTTTSGTGTGALSTPRLRLAALRLLGALPRVVRYDVLHPSKADVLRGLDAALDDPKKSVRREAVDAREVWFKYTG